MRFLAILNRDGGTLKTIDLDDLSGRMKRAFQDAGHAIEVEIVAGKGIEKALVAAAKRTDCDVVMAGGGDGTISAAAGALAGSEKALAVLPAGTMNLFARSLGIPLDLDEAVKAFADGVMKQVDVATANDAVFIHQFSIGLHARLVQLRSRMEYASRIGKILASIRAGIAAVRDPRHIGVKLTIDGSERRVVTTGMGVTNNIFGTGHLPYPDDPAGGVLGIYVASAATRLDMIVLAIRIATGRMTESEIIDLSQGTEVIVEVEPSRRRGACVIDGELCSLEKRTAIKILPGQLKVLVPAHSWSDNSN